jgi:hypothetical protein
MDVALPAEFFCEVSTSPWYICEKLGVAYQRVATDQPLELTLFEFLEQRRRRKTRGRV